MHGLTEQHISTIKDAARKLTGAKRRAFQARVTLDYLGGNARKAEKGRRELLLPWRAD